VVVPDAAYHVAASVLSSTIWIAILSEAVPLMAMVVALTTVLFEGEVIAIDGAEESGGGIGLAATSFDFDPWPNMFTALT